MIRFHTLRREQWIPRPLDEVFAFFSDARNLGEITPSWLGFRIFTPGPIRMAAGTRIRCRVRYRLPFGIAGRGVHFLKVRRDLERIFDYRLRRVQEVLGGPAPASIERQ